MSQPQRVPPPRADRGLDSGCRWCIARTRCGHTTSYPRRPWRHSRSGSSVPAHCERGTGVQVAPHVGAETRAGAAEGLAYRLDVVARGAAVAAREEVAAAVGVAADVGPEAAGTAAQRFAGRFRVVPGGARIPADRGVAAERATTAASDLYRHRPIVRADEGCDAGASRIEPDRPRSGRRCDDHTGCVCLGRLRPDR